MKNTSKVGRKTLKILRIICLGIALLGVLYKVLNYPGAEFILIAGFAGLAACYFVLAFYNRKTDTSRSILYALIAACLWIVLLLLLSSDIRAVLSYGLFYSVVIVVIASIGKKPSTQNKGTTIG